MWPCPWNCIEFTIYLDRIIYRGLSGILKTHARAPKLGSFSLPAPENLFFEPSSSPSQHTTMDGSRDYDLFVRQQPKQARMCGVGGTFLLFLNFF